VGFAPLLVSIAGRRVRLQTVDQAVRRLRDFFYGTIEYRLIRVRRLRRAAQLAHELQGGGLDFVVRGRRGEVRQGFYISAHAGK